MTALLISPPGRRPDVRTSGSRSCRGGNDVFNMTPDPLNEGEAPIVLEAVSAEIREWADGRRTGPTAAGSVA
jgi:hypothetical protein